MKNLTTVRPLEDVTLQIAAASGKPVIVPRESISIEAMNELGAKPLVDVIRALSDATANGTAGRDLWTARAVGRYLAEDATIMICVGRDAKRVHDPARSLFDVLADALADDAKLDGPTAIAHTSITVRVTPRIIGG